jgi:hypothetical protein
VQIKPRGRRSIGCGTWSVPKCHGWRLRGHLTGPNLLRRELIGPLEFLKERLETRSSADGGRAGRVAPRRCPGPSRRGIGTDNGTSAGCPCPGGPPGSRSRHLGIKKSRSSRCGKRHCVTRCRKWLVNCRIQQMSSYKLKRDASHCDALVGTVDVASAAKRGRLSKPDCLDEPRALRMPSDAAMRAHSRRPARLLWGTDTQYQGGVRPSRLRHWPSRKQGLGRDVRQASPHRPLPPLELQG